MMISALRVVTVSIWARRFGSGDTNYFMFFRSLFLLVGMSMVKKHGGAVQEEKFNNTLFADIRVFVCVEVCDVFCLLAVFP